MTDETNQWIGSLDRILQFDGFITSQVITDKLGAYFIEVVKIRSVKVWKQLMRCKQEQIICRTDPEIGI